MKTWKTTLANVSTSCSLATIIAIGMAQAAVAAPSPSTWDLEQTFTPGASPTGASPWESRYAIGMNCETDQGFLTVPWSRDSGKLSGRNAPTVDAAGGAANPVIFKNVSTGLSSPPTWGLNFGANQVGMTTSATRCAVLRFVAPADGMYKASGEFFSPINQASNTTNPATNKVMAFVRSGSQQSSGLVDKPAGIQSWTIPGAPVYALQAGQFIDFAVRDSGSGVINDVAMLSARVAWVDVLPPQPGIFKASNFDFEGSHGCAIEQGTNKLYCWGKASTSGLMLGNNSTVDQNKAVPATAVDAFLTTNNLGTVQNIQVGATNNCIRTAAATVCFGENSKGESGNPSSGSIIKDVTTQLGPYQGARLDGSTGCIITAAPNPNPEKIQCWGNNQINTPAYGGLLGWKNGTSFTSSHLPLTPVPNVDDAKDVAPGGVMSCAVVGPQGKVICWSKNPWGDAILGGGYPTPSGDLLPNPDGIWQVYVKTALGVDLTGAKRVSANGTHACAMTNAGQLHCWGLNATIAAATGAPSPNPIWAWQLAHARLVGFPNGVTDFAINGSATCVVAGAAAQVFCQGHNTYGQIGDPNTGANKLFTFGTYAPGVYGSQTVYSNLQSGTPKPVPNLTQIQKIRSGSGSQGFCALDANATIWCWGRGDSGQLGNGASLSSHVPVKVIK